MAGSILPMVHEERRKRKIPIVFWIHTLGNLVGGAVFGWVLGLLGATFIQPALSIWHGLVVLLITGLFALAYSIHELRLFRLVSPQFDWQVPSRWRYTLPPRLTALLYGLGLGVGVLTRIPLSTFYVAAIWAFLVANPLLSACCMTIYGLGRALPLLVISLRSENLKETLQITDKLHVAEP